MGTYRPLVRKSDGSTAELPLTDVIEGGRYLDLPVTTVITVDGSRSDPYAADGTITKPFKSIQNAVDAAPGDATINIYPGTYVGDINFDKSLTVIGNNSTIVGSVTAGEQLTLKNLTLNHTDHVLTIDSNTYGPLIIERCIFNCTSQVYGVAAIFRDVSGTGDPVSELKIVDCLINANMGISLNYGVDGLDVRGNVFRPYSNTGQGDAIKIRTPMTNVRISDNHIHKVGSIKYLKGVFIGSGQESAGTGSIDIIHNSIDSCANEEVTVERGIDVTIKGNAIKGDESDVSPNLLIRYDTVWNDLTITDIKDNEFLGGYAVANLTGGTLNCSLNWWGNSTGPDDTGGNNIIQGTGGRVSTMVEAEPFITKGNRTSDIRNDSTIAGHTLRNALELLEARVTALEP